MPEEERSFNENEPYQALYRRYRPQRFADVLGQEHVSRALLNAVREGQGGPRLPLQRARGGPGKTSTARILAMALNCEAPVGGEPDGTCASCSAIRAGSSMDVFELDAASNRKLDEMRDLLSRVALGTPGRWKVYIVDEVHQLTSDAASALLKTLEEPPSHVVFVLATTDPQKVLPTILSRTQHFEFRLLDGDLLTDLLSGINQDAGLGFPRSRPNSLSAGVGARRGTRSPLWSSSSAAGGGEDDGSPLSELVDALLATRYVSGRCRPSPAPSPRAGAPQTGERPGGVPAQRLLGGPGAISRLVARRRHGQACRKRRQMGLPSWSAHGNGGPGHG